METKFLYRYSDSFDWLKSDELSSEPTLRLEKFQIMRSTRYAEIIAYCRWQKGKLLSEKIVLRGTRKRFAYPTEAEALESYKARKRRQILLLEQSLVYARERLIKACEE
jgi:hypothetical protein